MRHESCLTCKLSGDITPLQRFATEYAEIEPGVHHHHVMECGDCGSLWFEDVVTGPLGVPVAARRDTVLCGCPEDSAARFTPSIAIVRVPEEDCHCSAAYVSRAKAV